MIGTAGTGVLARLGISVLLGPEVAEMMTLGSIILSIVSYQKSVCGVMILTQVKSWMIWSWGSILRMFSIRLTTLISPRRYKFAPYYNRLATVL